MWCRGKVMITAVLVASRTFFSTLLVAARQSAIVRRSGLQIQIWSGVRWAEASAIQRGVPPGATNSCR